MDAIKLLTKEHEAVKRLLEELTATTPRAIKGRRELLDKIRIALEAHTTIEEEIFYPAFKSHGSNPDDDKMYFEALEEHRAAGDLVLPDLLSTSVESEKFSGRAKVLRELVSHHADEEEEEMFPRAKKLLGKDELEQLGNRMAERSSELIAKLQSKPSNTAK